MGVEAGGIGARLRAGREKMGLTVLQVAERIHTDPKIVEAIEAENFDALGAPVYARGHIRHYAELVGESATELIGLYSNLSKVAQPDLTQIVKAPAGSDSNKLVAPALVVIGVFAVAGAIWWVSALSKKKPQLAETHVVGEEPSTPEQGSQSGPGATAGSAEVSPQANSEGGQGISAGAAGAGSRRAGSANVGAAGTGTGSARSGATSAGAVGAGPGPGRSGSTSSGSATGAANTPAPAQSRGAPTVGAQAGAMAPGRSGAAGNTSATSTSSRGRAEPPSSQAPTRVASASTSGSSAPSSSTGSDAAQPAAAAPPRSKNQAQVTLRYSADSWTEVYDAAGARLFYDVGAANSVQTVVGAPPLRVVLGNASGVAVEFNGHHMPISKLAHPDGSVQFSINRSGRVIRAKPVADGG